MTDLQQKNVVAYGESIGILVTPILDCGIHGVDIGHLRTFDEHRAHVELQSLDVLQVGRADASWAA